MLELTNEWCAYCEEHVFIRNDKESKCTICNHKILPCSACNKVDKCDWIIGRGCLVFPENRNVMKKYTVTKEFQGFVRGTYSTIVVADSLEEALTFNGFTDADMSIVREDLYCDKVEAIEITVEAKEIKRTKAKKPENVELTKTQKFIRRCLLMK